MPPTHLTIMLGMMVFANRGCWGLANSDSCSGVRVGGRRQGLPGRALRDFDFSCAITALVVGSWRHRSQSSRTATARTASGAVTKQLPSSFCPPGSTRHPSGVPRHTSSNGILSASFGERRRFPWGCGAKNGSRMLDHSTNYFGLPGAGIVARARHSVRLGVVLVANRPCFAHNDQLMVGGCGWWSVCWSLRHKAFANPSP